MKRYATLALQPPPLSAGDVPPDSWLSSQGSAGAPVADRGRSHRQQDQDHWPFLAADLDLTPKRREDHAAYIASWLKVLKDDKRAIFTAASHAQRGAFLHGLQPTAQTEEAAAA